MGLPHKPSQPREVRFTTKFNQDDLVATLNDDHQTIEDAFAKLRKDMEASSDKEAIAALEARVTVLEERKPVVNIMNNETTIVEGGEPTPNELTQDQMDALKGTFGHPNEANRYVTNDDPRLKIGVSGAMPTGTVIDYAGSVAPSGWLLCNGASFSRIERSALFRVIGTTYGSVDADSFNVPDCRGRSTMGTGQLDGDITKPVRALGNKLGVEEHLLTGAESGVKAHSHTFEWLDNTTPDGSLGNHTGTPTFLGAGPIVNVPTSAVAAENATAFHPNVHPVIVFHKIIKA